MIRAVLAVCVATTGALGAPPGPFRAIVPAKPADSTGFAHRATLGAPRPGHSATVLAVAVSADGRRVATSASGRDVAVWDVAGARRVFTLTGHADDVFALSFAPDGRGLVTCDATGTCVLWELEGGAATRVVELPRDPEARPDERRAVAATFAGDGSRVALGLASGAIAVLDIERGTQAWRRRVDALPPLPRRPRPAAYVAWCDGDRAVAAGAGAVLLRCKASDGEVLDRRIVVGPDVRTLALQPGTGVALMVAIDAAAARATLLRAGFDDADHRFALHDPPAGAAYCASGAAVATFTRTRVDLRDPATLAPRASFTIAEAGAPLNVLALDARGARFAVAPYLGGDVRMRITLIDVERGEPLWRDAGPTSTVDALAYSPDGARLAAADRDGSCFLFDVAAERIALHWSWTGARGFAFREGTAASRLYSGGQAGLLEIDLRDTKARRVLPCTGGPFAPRGERQFVVLPEFGGAAQFVDLETGAVERPERTRVPGRWLAVIADSAGAGTAVRGAWLGGGKLSVRDFASGTDESIEVGDAAILGARFVADGARLIEVARGRLRLLGPASGASDRLEVLASVEPKGPLTGPIATSADGARFAVGAVAPTADAAAVVVFDAATCTELDRIPLPVATRGCGIGGIAFGPAGEIAVATADGAVECYAPR